MDKYTRDSPLPGLVLEIQASLSVNHVGAISTPKFGQVSYVSENL